MLGGNDANSREGARETVLEREGLMEQRGREPAGVGF